jgi:Acetyltransferase (GNAT) domain
MIAVREVDVQDAEGWTGTVAACDGNPLHVPAVTASEYPGIPCRGLVFERDGRVIGCALAYFPPRRRLRFLPAGNDLELPTAVAIGPEHRTSETKDALYGALLAHARDRRARLLVIRPRWGDEFSDLPRLAPFVRSGTLEFVVDLDRDEEGIRGAMHKFHRKNVRRAEREGLAVVNDPSLAGLLRLRDLQRNSADRSASRGGGFGIRTDAFFRDVHARVYSLGLGDVLFARDGEAELAALAVVTAAGKGITVRSGSTPQGYERLAMYLLQDAVLRRGRERGLRELNLGGVPEGAREEGHVQHGLYQFKKGFGGRECLRHAVVMPVAAGEADRR